MLFEILHNLCLVSGIQLEVICKTFMRMSEEDGSVLEDDLGGTGAKPALSTTYKFTPTPFDLIACGRRETGDR